MKKNVLTIFFSLLIIFVASAQDKKVEVLYFKANLGCCLGRACNLLQSDVDSVVTKYFSDKKVAFKVVRLNDPQSQAIIEKYKAKSQSVILVNKKRKKEKVVDLTTIVDNYKADKDKAKFEAEMKKKIKEAIK